MLSDDVRAATLMGPRRFYDGRVYFLCMLPSQHAGHKVRFCYIRGDKLRQMRELRDHIGHLEKQEHGLEKQRRAVEKILQDGDKMETAEQSTTQKRETRRRRTVRKKTRSHSERTR